MLLNLFNSSIYTSDIIDLEIAGREKPSAGNQNVETIYYDICLHRGGFRVGECDLRVGMNEELYYAGNIGYRIYDGYRGNHYAYYAAKMLMNIAREKYKMDHMIITCSPDNIPSEKTLIRLGGHLEKTVDVPSWHWLYKRGETSNYA